MMLNHEEKKELKIKREEGEEEKGEMEHFLEIWEMRRKKEAKSNQRSKLRMDRERKERRKAVKNR